MTQVESPEDVAVAAHRALAAAGLSDMIWGHASVRLPDGSGIMTKSSGWSFEEITPQRLVRVSWDGRRLAGEGTVHIEVPIHTRIMAARPEVEAVVHTHAPAVTAFASLGVPMRAISHDGVPFASQLLRFERTGNLIDSAELGDALAHDLGAASAIVIPQHGSVTVGRQWRRPSCTPSCSSGLRNVSFSGSGSGWRPSGVVRRRRAGGEAGAGVVPQADGSGLPVLCAEGVSFHVKFPPT